MRFVSFYSGGRTLAGALEGSEVCVIGCTSMIEFIGLPPRDRHERISDDKVPLAGLRLAAPVRPMRNVFCVGRNYLEHAKEGARALGRELKLPNVPTFFTKSASAIADPGATLNLQASVSSEYDYEAELGVVIGRRCKDVSEAEALECVFGYTCVNDVTARDLQRAHGQWFKGKSLDETCPIGPWIVTPDEIGDVQHLQITFRLDGVVKQSSNSASMIFPVARLIAELSRGMTLEPGDVIATGTPEGVGFARTPPEFLRDGQVMEVEVENIGILRNAVGIA